MPQNKSVYIILFIAVAILVCSRCVDTAVQSTDARGEQFAGSKACVSCHQHITGSYAHTAHFKTTSPVPDTPAMYMKHDANDTFLFPDEKLVVEKDKDGFYQTSYRHGEKRRKQRLDIAIGSGEKAVSFAYWKENKLYQLPLSLFTAAPVWANSPGLPSDRPYFDRIIMSGCFECHASYTEKDYTQTGGLAAGESFIRSSIIFGIDCERCHGPAASHVDYHQQHPGEKTGKNLARWASLSRQQKLDACAVCHSGNDLEMQRSRFAFQPGDTLADFFLPSFGSGSSEPDVRGKQMQLLAASACFKNSKGMDCTSCHNPHQPKESNVATLSQRCLTCHQPSGEHYCKLADSLGPAITQNCIDCHMPKQASKAIAFQEAEQGQTTAYYLRTHKIAVYPDETKKIVSYLKRTGSVAAPTRATFLPPPAK